LSLSLVAMVNNHTSVAIVLIEKSANERERDRKMERGSGKRDEDYNHSSIANFIIT
jgi:hypothetical protein